jgi:hypothetical protein
MKLVAIALITLATLSFTLIPADARRHHRASHSAGGANGTAGGATTLSGTGSSQFGGSNPGTSGKN